MALTGRTPLLGLLGVLIVATAWPSAAGVAAVSGGLLLLVALDVALAAPVRPLRLDRSGDTAARLGSTATVSLRLTNPGRRPLAGVVRDAWPPSAGAQPARHPVRLPAGGSAVLRTVLRPTRRGDRHSERVSVRSVGPLGLAARQGAHTVPWRVRVLPPFDSRRHLPSRLARLRQLDGRTAVVAPGQGSEFDALREYVVGDDVRSIDWRATARAADVVVRTYRPERDRHVLIVLDTGRTSAGRIGDGTRLDTALDAALLLAALATRAGDRVDLLAFDRGVRAEVRGSSGPTAVLPAFVNAMADLEPRLVETDARSLVAAVLARARQRSLVVLLTGLDPVPVEEGLLPVLPQLRRHVVVAAGVADPRLAELAAGRGDVAAVYALAAAERTRIERARAADRLRRGGVVVLEAPPAELAPRLADTYLDLKAAGRL